MPFLCGLQGTMLPNTTGVCANMISTDTFAADDGVYMGNKLFVSARVKARTMCLNHEDKPYTELWERLSFLIGLPILEKLERTGRTWLELCVAEGNAGRLLDSLEVIKETGKYDTVRDALSVRLRLLRRYLASGGDPTNKDFVPKPKRRRTIPLLGADHDTFMVHQLLPYPMWCLKLIHKKEKKFDLMGLYATKESAQRVITQARYNLKVFDYVRQHAVSFDLVDHINPEDSITNSYRHITPEYIFASNCKVSRPLAKPLEDVWSYLKPCAVGIKTENLHGRTVSLRGLGGIRTERRVIEASGDLEVYIASET